MARNGTNGTDGTDGTNGAPGSRWYQGTGAPAAATGVLGDWYVNTATSDVYEKTAASTWTLRLNIKGAGGTNGVSGWEIVSNSTDNVSLPIDAGFEASCPSGKVPLGGGSSVQLKNAAGGFVSLGEAPIYSYPIPVRSWVVHIRQPAVTGATQARITVTTTCATMN
jgi:hypothetical protein